jgi:F-type H+-transporting ATPase subunit epsilon
MANLFKLDILSPQGNIFSGNVKQITVPTTSGLITILAGHASLITIVSKGDIEIMLEDNSIKNFTVIDGFLEVSDNIVSIISDFAMKSDDINDDVIEKAKKYAEEQKQKNDNVPAEIEEKNLQQAIMALKVLEHNKLKRKKGVKY